MCGIAGTWDRRGRRDEEVHADLAAMSATLAHRGPDDEGAYVSEGLGLGHRRLAVIDCSPTGHQPMASAGGRFVVVSNSEVYNYLELRDELRGEGYEFRGTSDTEVLVAGFERWGVDRTLTRANGMFALAVWDAAERVLHLGRDRFGEKPLYYGWAGATFLFASELAALRAHPGFAADLDRDALALYFRHNCIPAPWSVYHGVRKLLPGTTVRLRLSDGPGTLPEPVPFWSLATVAEAGQAARGGIGSAPGDTGHELDEILGTAVGIRLRSDVPVGAFLSGGIDSSLIVALMQAKGGAKVRTFTIAFEDAAFDESRQAAAVAAHLGTEHCEMVVTAADALGIIPELPHLYDEPFADSSQVPQAILARLTRRHVTVALSGDGGDELFGGYNRYGFAAQLWPTIGRVPRPLRRAAARAISAVPSRRWDALFDRAGPLLPQRLRVRMPGTKIGKLARVLPAAGLEDAYRLLASHLDDPAVLVLGASEPPTVLTTAERWPVLEHPIERMLYLDTVTYLPDDILTKVDRATMAVNLESRLPFLDPSVAAFAWRLPFEQKVQRGVGKWVLRRLLERYVPTELFERPKAGFGIPVGDWLRGPLRPWAEDLLGAELLERQGLLDSGRVRAMWRDHLSGRADWPYELWDVLMLQAWLEAWAPGL